MLRGLESGSKLGTWASRREIRARDCSSLFELCNRQQEIILQLGSPRKHLLDDPAAHSRTRCDPSMYQSGNSLTSRFLFCIPQRHSRAYLPWHTKLCLHCSVIDFFMNNETGRRNSQDDGDTEDWIDARRGVTKGVSITKKQFPAFLFLSIFRACFSFNFAPALRTGNGKLDIWNWMTVLWLSMEAVECLPLERSYILDEGGRAFNKFTILDVSASWFIYCPF